MIPAQGRDARGQFGRIQGWVETNRSRPLEGSGARTQFEGRESSALSPNPRPNLYPSGPAYSTTKLTPSLCASFVSSNGLKPRPDHSQYCEMSVL